MSFEDLPLVTFLADLIETDGEDAVITQIANYAAQTLGADWAGVTLLRARRRFETVGATNPLVVEIDRLQYELREGVCVDAAVEGRMVHSDDVATDARWPRWGPAAGRLGVHAMVACELHAGGRRLGALNVYGATAGQFDYEDREILRTFAAPASAAVSVARKIEGLSTAIDTRNLIGQAQGILIAKLGVDAETAFAILVRYSQDSHTKLRAVAETVVRERGLPEIAG